MTKKNYDSPALTIYGTVSQLTHWYGESTGSDILYTAPDDDTVFATSGGCIAAVINPCITQPGDPLCGTNQP